MTAGTLDSWSVSYTAITNQGGYPRSILQREPGTPTCSHRRLRCASQDGSFCWFYFHMSLRTSLAAFGLLTRMYWWQVEVIEVAVVTGGEVYNGTWIVWGGRRALQKTKTALSLLRKQTTQPNHDSVSYGALQHPNNMSPRGRSFLLKR